MAVINSTLHCDMLAPLLRGMSAPYGSQENPVISGQTLSFRLDVDGKTFEEEFAPDNGYLYHYGDQDFEQFARQGELVGQSLLQEHCGNSGVHTYMLPDGHGLQQITVTCDYLNEAGDTSTATYGFWLVDKITAFSQIFSGVVGVPRILAYSPVLDVNEPDAWYALGVPSSAELTNTPPQYTELTNTLFMPHGGHDVPANNSTRWCSRVDQYRTMIWPFSSGVVNFPQMHFQSNESVNGARSSAVDDADLENFASQLGVQEHEVWSGPVIVGPVRSPALYYGMSAKLFSSVDFDGDFSQGDIVPGAGTLIQTSGGVNIEQAAARGTIDYYPYPYGNFASNCVVKGAQVKPIKKRPLAASTISQSGNIFNDDYHAGGVGDTVLSIDYFGNSYSAGDSIHIRVDRNDAALDAQITIAQNGDFSYSSPRTSGLSSDDFLTITTNTGDHIYHLDATAPIVGVPHLEPQSTCGFIDCDMGHTEEHVARGHGQVDMSYRRCVNLGSQNINRHPYTIRNEPDNRPKSQTDFFTGRHLCGLTRWVGADGFRVSIPAAFIQLHDNYIFVQDGQQNNPVQTLQWTVAGADVRTGHHDILFNRTTYDFENPQDGTNEHGDGPGFRERLYSVAEVTNKTSEPLFFSYDDNTDPGSFLRVADLPLPTSSVVSVQSVKGDSSIYTFNDSHLLDTNGANALIEIDSTGVQLQSGLLSLTDASQIRAPISVAYSNDVILAAIAITDLNTSGTDHLLSFINGDSGDGVKLYTSTSADLLSRTFRLDYISSVQNSRLQETVVNKANYKLFLKIDTRDAAAKTFDFYIDDVAFDNSAMGPSTLALLNGFPQLSTMNLDVLSVGHTLEGGSPTRAPVSLSIDEVAFGRDFTLAEFVAWQPVAYVASNNAPSISAIGDRSYSVNDSVNFTVASTDSDGTIASLTVDQLPAGLSLNASNPAAAVVSGTLTTEQTLTSVFTVTDDNGDTTTEAVLFTVAALPVNQSPTIVGIGNRSYNVGDTANFTFTSTDSDGTITSLTVDQLPAGLSLNASNPAAAVVSGTLTTEQTLTSVFTATDNAGGIATQVVAFTVTAVSVNQAPSIGNIGNRSHNVGDAVIFTVASTDSDGTIASLTVDQLPAGLSLDASNPAAAVVSGTLTTEQTLTSVFTATDDDDDTTTESIVFAVTSPATVVPVAADSASGVCNFRQVIDKWFKVG